METFLVTVNPAAYTAVDKAESEPELAMAVNGIAPGVIAEEAKHLGAGIVHYSTDYVFKFRELKPEERKQSSLQCESSKPLFSLKKGEIT